MALGTGFGSHKLEPTFVWKSETANFRRRLQPLLLELVLILLHQFSHFGGALETILIEFNALRNPAGKYLGCLEHTQDVEHIRRLEGQNRLLD